MLFQIVVTSPVGRYASDIEVLSREEINRRKEEISRYISTRTFSMTDSTGLGLIIIPVEIMQKSIVLFKVSEEK